LIEGDGDYGSVYVAGKSQRAHRLSYEIAYGRIPDGLLVRHKCDTPACVRPDHLELGTHADNSRDRTIRGRVPVGTMMSHSKLTDDLVREIRAAPPSVTSVELARRLGCTHQTVWAARTGRTWRHVT